jgi:hypothetical protein
MGCDYVGAATENTGVTTVAGVTFAMPALPAPPDYGTVWIINETLSAT